MALNNDFWSSYENNQDVEVSKIVATLNFQPSTLTRSQSRQAFHLFIEYGLHRSYKEYYSVFNLTCNHAIENIFRRVTGTPAQYKNLWGFFQDRANQLKSDQYDQRFYKAGFASDYKKLVGEFSDFHEIIENALLDHEVGNIYGRQQ